MPTLFAFFVFITSCAGENRRSRRYYLHLFILRDKPRVENVVLGVFEQPNPLRSLPTDAQAQILRHLPLHEINRNDTIFGERRETNGVVGVAYEETLNALRALDPLAATAVGMRGPRRPPEPGLRPPRFPDPRTTVEGHRRSRTASFQRLASAARDAGGATLPDDIQATASRGLRSEACFRVALQHACGNETILENLIAAWPIQDKDVRDETEPLLRRSLESKPHLLAAFEARQAAFTGVHTWHAERWPSEWEAIAGFLETTRLIADPALRAQELTAFREFGRSSEQYLAAVIDHIELIEDPALRGNEFVAIRKTSRNSRRLIGSLANKTHLIGDAVLRGHEHVALREAANDDSFALLYLIHRTDLIDDPALRAQEHAALRMAANGAEPHLARLAELLDRIENLEVRRSELGALREAANGNERILSILSRYDL